MKFGLIGGKLSHSFSKEIHEKISLYDYQLKELSPENLEDFMKAKDFKGINVTIPYKTAVLPFMDFIDEAAEKTGAVNTVINKNGRLYGYNTDYYGLKGLIERENFCLENKKILILGTGGTSKTAFAVAESLNAAEIVTVSRNGDVNYGNVCDLHPDADFIINTTPCGMFPDNYETALSITDFTCLKGVIDVIYNPLKTRLCLEAERLGIKSCTGLYMLILQAVIACEKFTENNIDVKKSAEELYKVILSEKRNIVLIGMPGSGKSTVGRLLAENTGRDFIDTDTVLVNKYGDISELFASKGETFFRDIETDVIFEVSKSNGTVISTGGGAVMRDINVQALKQNGIIVFLDRALEDITPTPDRPLAKNREALKKCFEERYDRYCEVSDFTVKVNGSAESTAGQITEMLR